LWFDIAGSQPRFREQIGPIRYQPTTIHPGPLAVDRRQTILNRQFDDEVTVPGHSTKQLGHPSRRETEQELYSRVA
jgi:hypothetical protein